MNISTTSTTRSRLSRWTRLARGLATALALTTVLAAGACGTSTSTSTSPRSARPSSSESASPSSGVRVAERASEPGTAGASAPEASEAPTEWSAPSVKFYNESTALWHQDDSVVNLGAAGDNGNIEGYRTNDGACLGYVSREASADIYATRGDDAILSELETERLESALSSYNAEGVAVVDLIRDDSGTMQGYERAFTASYDTDDGASEPVVGYRFARTVGDKGFRLSVMTFCRADSGLSVEQWHTILSGLRLEGIDAGPM